MEEGSEGSLVSSRVVRHVEEYLPDRLVEVVCPVGAQSAPVVLLWHGSGPDERDALVPLAAAIAARGPVAFVPDWRSDDLEIGARELLASIEFTLASAAAMGGNPDRVLLLGWSLGASAAADIGFHPVLAGGWRPAGLVGLGGGYDRTPFARTSFESDPVRADTGTGWEGGDESSGIERDSGGGRSVLLVHGTADRVVPVERSVVGAGVFAGAGWRVVLRQVDTDHAGSIGTVYDRERKRCVPSDDPDRRRVMRSVADEVAGLVMSPG